MLLLLLHFFCQFFVWGFFEAIKITKTFFFLSHPFQGFDSLDILKHSIISRKVFIATTNSERIEWNADSNDADMKTKFREKRVEEKMVVELNWKKIGKLLKPLVRISTHRVRPLFLSLFSLNSLQSYRNRSLQVWFRWSYTNDPLVNSKLVDAIIILSVD